MSVGITLEACPGHRMIGLDNHSVFSGMGRFSSVDQGNHGSQTWAIKRRGIHLSGLREND